jgi:pimeloyl-ACP methyl ester carboxylesterase
MVRRRMAVTTEHTDRLDGEPVFWRSAPSDDGRPPVLYVHGLATSSDLWTPFLERTGGVAVDLPGFGRSTKRGDLDVSVAGYGRFLESFARHAGIGELRLVVHGWGAVALPWAAARADPVTRLAVIAGLPLFAGFAWPAPLAALRRRGLGEVAMGLAGGPVVRWASRRANATPGPLPRAFLDAQLAHFDQGTQRAVLRIVRAAEPADAGLSALRAPALVAWGARDPYVPADLGARYAAALGGPVDELRAENAGHFPWLDDFKLVETVSDFLGR